MKKLLNTLYVTNPEAFACKKDDNVCVRIGGKDALKVPFHLLEGIVLFNYAGCSSALIAACASKGIGLAILDEKGRFAARVEGPVSGNVLLRLAQYRKADDEAFSLRLSKRFVVAKLRNSRFVLMKQVSDYPELEKTVIPMTVNTLRNSEDACLDARSSQELLGIEGDAAHAYFGSLQHLIRIPEVAETFSGRNRRPPKDPVNAALSFFYALMARELATACETVGLDPQCGFYHRPRPGRSSLALDLIEEFRAPYVDRFVLSLFNRRQIGASDFRSDGEGGVFFADDALKRALDAWQRRKQDEMVHPFLKEKVKMGLLPFVQAQLLARHLRGDLDDYPALLWR